MTAEENEYLHRLKMAYEDCLLPFQRGRLNVKELLSICNRYSALPGVVLDMLEEAARTP